MRPWRVVTGFARDVMTTFSRQVVSTVLNVGLVVLLARVLGPQGNGQYALSILLPELLAQALNIGVAPANVYYLGRSRQRTSTALWATLLLWAILSVVGLSIAAAVVTWGRRSLFPGIPSGLLVFAALVYPVSLFKQLLLSVVQGRENFRAYNVLRLAVPTVTVLAALVLVWGLGLGVIGALWAYLVGQVAGTAVGLATLWEHFRRERARRVVAYARAAMGYGWKVHGANVTMFVNYRLDLFLVNVFLGTAAAGVYTVAIQIAERLWVLSDVTSTVLLPKLAGLHRDEERRRRLTPLVTRWVGYAGFAMAAGVAAIIEPLVRIVFGSEYLGAVAAVLWFLPGIVVMNFARIMASDIAARGRPGFNAVAALATLAANVVFTVTLIPRLETVGAALATSLAYSVSFLLTLAFFVRLSRVPALEPFIPTRSDWARLRRGLRSVTTREDRA